MIQEFDASKLLAGNFSLSSLVEDARLQTYENAKAKLVLCWFLTYLKKQFKYDYMLSCWQYKTSNKMIKVFLLFAITENCN